MKLHVHLNKHVNLKILTLRNMLWMKRLYVIMHEKGVWPLVPPPTGKTIIGNHWVFTLK